MPKAFFAPNAKPALFLDRDGVINLDRGYVSRVGEFNWVKGAIELIECARASGFWVIVVTNQSGIGRNYYTESDVLILHNWIAIELKKRPAKTMGIDRFYYCPFHEDADNATYKRKSLNRKPAPGMIWRACQDFPILLKESVLIGDKQTDMDAAQSAGVKGLRFDVMVCDNVFEFACAHIKTLKPSNL